MNWTVVAVVFWYFSVVGLAVGSLPAFAGNRPALGFSLLGSAAILAALMAGALSGTLVAR